MRMLQKIFIVMILIILCIFFLFWVRIKLFDNNITTGERAKNYIIDLGRQKGKHWDPDSSNFFQSKELRNQWIFTPDGKCKIYISAEDSDDIDVVGVEGNCQ